MRKCLSLGDALFLVCKSRSLFSCKAKYVQHLRANHQLDVNAQEPYLRKKGLKEEYVRDVRKRKVADASELLDE